MKVGIVENEPIHRNWLKKELGIYGQVYAYKTIELLPSHNFSVIVIAVSHLNLTYTLQKVSNLLNQGKKLIVLSTLPNNAFNKEMYKDLCWIEKPYGPHKLHSTLLKVKAQLQNL